MKNKLLLALFMTVLVLSVTGCGKKDTLKDVKVTGPRVVCKDKQVSDGITLETVVTRKFNSDNYLNYQVSKYIQTFDSKETYKAYADSVKESADTMELEENLQYSYSLNSKDMKITTIMVYNEALFDYDNVSSEDKKTYFASNMIKAAEDAGAECEFIETTRSELGVE